MREGWKKVKLKDVSNIGDGAHASLERQKKGIPYLTSKNLKRGKIDLTTYDCISIDTYNKHFKESENAITVPNQGDILFSIIGSMGSPYLLSKDKLIGISSSVSIIRAKPNINNRYLYYWLLSEELQSAINGVKGGVAQSYVSLKMIGDLLVKYPDDLSTQTRIASVISTYDDLIENNEKRIKILEEMAQRLYTEWFVKFEFPAPQPPKGGAIGCSAPRVLNAANPKSYKKLYDKAVKMRNFPTKAEALLWEELKLKKLGMKFRRQHIIDNFIVDFYCVEIGLIIEVDGEIHQSQKDKDQKREETLKSLGCQIIRFSNEEVINNINQVITKIKSSIPSPSGEYKPKSPLGDLGVKGYKSSGGKMVDSGSEYGMVPEGWEVKRLGDIGDVVTGKTPSKKISENFGDEFLFVKTPDFTDLFILNSEEKLSERGMQTQIKKLLPEKTVMVSTIGTLGKVAISTQSCTTNQQINSLVLNSPNDYIYYYFFSKELKPLLDGLGGNGATMGNVSKGKFEEIKILYPTLGVMNNYYISISKYFDEILNFQKKNSILLKTRDLLIGNLITGKRLLKNDN
ncbi:MAG: restriction endonuclease subunit S [bacterium]